MPGSSGSGSSDKSSADDKSESRVSDSSSEADDSDDEKPKKKRISGYILYSNAHREEAKEVLTVDGEKPKNPDVMRKLAEMWKALAEDEQGEWNAKAKEMKEAE